MVVLILKAVDDARFEGKVVTQFSYEWQGELCLVFHAHPSKDLWIIKSRGIGTALATLAIQIFCQKVGESSCAQVLQKIGRLDLQNDGQIPSNERAVINTIHILSD